MYLALEYSEYAMAQCVSIQPFRRKDCNRFRGWDGNWIRNSTRTAISRCECVHLLSRSSKTRCRSAGTMCEWSFLSIAIIRKGVQHTQRERLHGVRGLRHLSSEKSRLPGEVRVDLCTRCMVALVVVAHNSSLPSQLRRRSVRVAC